MLDHEAQERLGALLVIGFGPEVVVERATLGAAATRSAGVSGENPSS
ncbi:MAG: hypothetical protein ACLP0J_10385 [Solirubrobacteraceae bacterium]|jgi:hypothetical protein